MSESVVKSELQSIYDAEQQLTPSLVLNRARSKSSPLHHYFEWDDSVAGEKYRLGQAQRLITTVRVVYRDATGDEKRVRKWHAVQTPDRDWNYKTAEEIATDEMLAKIKLADMKRDWQTFLRRYEDMAGFISMIQDSLKGKAA